MSEETTEEKIKTRKTLRTFAIASFLNDVGSDIINPIWPLFVTQAIAGILWDKAGRQMPFILSLGLTGAAALLLLFVKEKRSSPLPRA